jgi:hypothetical protein
MQAVFHPTRRTSQVWSKPAFNAHFADGTTRLINGDTDE